MNNSNLIHLDKRTKKERREIAKKGGIKSGQVRREKKKMKDALISLLSLKVTNKKDKKVLEELGLEENEMNNQALLIVSALNQAKSGNVNAMTFIRDTIGEKEADKIEMKEIPIINDDIGKSE